MKRILAAVIMLLTATLNANESTDAPTEHIVEIIRFKFSPASLSINPGDRVTWINRDVVAHNVAGGITDTWQSPKLLQGESFSLVLTSDLTYVCTYHEASMSGMVLVK